MNRQSVSGRVGLISATGPSSLFIHYPRCFSVLPLPANKQHSHSSHWHFVQR